MAHTTVPPIRHVQDLRPVSERPWGLGMQLSCWTACLLSMQKGLGSVQGPHKIEQSNPCLQSQHRGGVDRSGTQGHPHLLQQVQVQSELHEILLKGGREEIGLMTGENGLHTHHMTLSILWEEEQAQWLRTQTTGKHYVTRNYNCIRTCSWLYGNKNHIRPDSGISL